jgi:hypothetical protein
MGSCKGGNKLNKAIIIIQLLFSLSLPVYSFELRNNIRFGIFGLGVSSENKSASGYMYGGAAKFTYQSDHGFGGEISPLHFSYINEGSGYFALTFINTALFYNFFKHENFVLGPFTSINAIKYKDPGFFELHAGIRFSVCNISFWDLDLYKDSIFGYDVLIIELGYRYNNRGKHGFHAFIGTDLLTGLYTLAAIASGDNIKKHQEEYPTY